MGVLDPSDVTLEFGAGKSGGKRIVGISFGLHFAVCRMFDDYGTGIRAIHGACSGCFLILFTHRT
jgi:hypothetical protein